MPKLLDLEETKLWLRVDEDEEDLLIQTLIDAAEEYAKTAVGSNYDPTKAKTKLLAMTCVADWYENRSLVGQDTSDKMRPIVRSLIMQLRYEGDDDAS